MKWKDKKAAEKKADGINTERPAEKSMVKLNEKSTIKSALRSVAAILFSLLAAVGLTANRPITGYAADSLTTMTGTIATTQLSITIPIDSRMSVVPESGNTYKQVVGMDVEITNDSNVDVTVSITSVSAEGVILVNRPNQLDAPRSMMLAMKMSKPSKNNPSDWLMEGTGQDYSLGQQNNLLKAGGTLKVFVSGITRSGWMAGDTYSVTPRLTFTAVSTG